VKIIRLPKVEDKVGLKHSAIYEKIDRGQFPRQVPLGPKAVGWLEDEVDAWIEARKAERDAADGHRSKLKKASEQYLCDSKLRAHSQPRPSAVPTARKSGEKAEISLSKRKSSSDG
jgi:prophage regulatory protein